MLASPDASARFTTSGTSDTDNDTVGAAATIRGADSVDAAPVLHPARDAPGVQAEGESLVPGDSCPATVYLARLAPTGRRVQATALNQIAKLVTEGEADAESMPWHLLRYAHTSAIRAHLAAHYAPATANRMLAALRGVLREAWRLGAMDGDAYHRATDLPAVRGERLPAGRAVSTGELTALFDGCPPTPGGTRDAALIAVLYGTGVRRSEAVALELSDVDLAGAAVKVRAGKGAKERMTYLPAGAVAAVQAWLEVRGDAPGPLFCPVRRGGHLQPGAPLSGQAVRAILRRRAVAARVEPFNPHSLRRSFVSTLLDVGADINSVRALCGHQSIQTTSRYDRRPEAAKAQAAGLLHVPYTPPRPPSPTTVPPTTAHDPAPPASTPPSGQPGSAAAG